MNTYFHRIFEDSKTPGHKAPARSNDKPATIEYGSENATRCRLVQILLRKVMCSAGIPCRWIECQTLLVSSGSCCCGMSIRLIIKHWDHRLMNYTFAIQEALLTEIEQFEPQASEWLHSIAWQLEMAESCPYTDLPEKTFWLEPGKTHMLASLMFTDVKPPAPLRHAEPAKSAKDNELMRDLERLFAIRDQKPELMPIDFKESSIRDCKLRPANG